MDTSLIVLDNIPLSYSEELMIEHIEATLDVDVQCAKIIGDLALFSLEHNLDDFEAAAKRVKKVTLEGRTIKLLPVDENNENAVAIYDYKSDVIHKTSLKKYFEQQFKDGKGCISSCKFWKKFKLGIIHFKPGSEKLVGKLLKKDKHRPVHGATVSIQPYYYNFHDLVEKRLPSDESVQAEIPCCEKVTSQCKEDDSSESESKSDNSSEDSSEQESDEDSEDQCERESHSEQESDESTSSEDQKCKNTGRHKGNFSDVTGSDGNNTYSESEDDSEEKNMGKQKGKSNIRKEKSNPDGNKGDPDLSDTEKNEKNFKQAKCKDESLDKPVEKVASFSLCSEKNNLPKERKEHAMSQAHYLLLKEHFGTFDNCSVEFLQDEKKAVFEGDEKDVSLRHWNMFSELREIEKDSLNLQGCLPQLLANEKGQHYLTNLREMESVTHCIDNDQLLLVSRSFNALNNAAERLRDVLNYKETFTTVNCQIPLEQLETLKTKLEKELLVNISWSVNQEEIFSEGVKDHVLLSKQDVCAMIEKFSEVTRTFVIESYKASYLRCHPSPKIKSIFQNVRDWSYDEGYSKGPMTYTFTGQNSSVSQVESLLQALVDNIVTRKIDFQKEYFSIDDIKVITLGLKTPEVKNKLEEFERQEKCFLKVKMPDESDLKDMNKKTQAKSDIFTAGTSCRILLKEGDIITEKADVLVCVLDKSINLKKTLVGKAFNSACSQLMEQLKTMHKENPSSLVHIVKGPFSPPLLSCLAICGVILSVWDEASSPTTLASILTNVLDEAIKMGARSVSLPTLGHGRMFKFPPKCISQIIIDTLQTYLSSDPALDEVIIMINDQEMLDTLKLVAQQNLTACSPTPLDIDSSSGDESADDTDEKTILDLAEAGDLEISVTMMKMDDPEKTLTKLKDLIKRRCLHTAEFENKMLLVLDQVIEEEAQNHLVYIRKSAGTESHPRKIIIKGFKKHVKKLESFIRTELSKIQMAMQNKILASGDAPPRGTMDFLMYAANITEMCPSYWGFCQQPSFLKRVLGALNYRFKGTEKKHVINVAVDKATKKAIVELFEKTWDSTHSGLGRDAKGLVSNAGCEVLNVERIENPLLFEPYAQTRKNLFAKYAEMGKMCDDLSTTLPRGQIRTTELLSSTLKDQLYHEVNEHYLFHGTKSNLIDALTQHGPDPKLCTNAMLGSGVYLAEASIKSDQYADPKNNRSPAGEELKMLLMRVLLGNTYVINRDHPRVQRGQGFTPLKRPPCAQCQSDVCSDVGHHHCDSVTLDSVLTDTRILFREFVVYDMSRCYPEYIITYKRK
ncbi:unnamed protein product [Lymnaea stagnalis]|uniref:Poly [ADP-ribose] polymerase n=1 Tax=Lymnaea stagnalis TaxID=6523 RepID=A0AAV2H1C3_LYMST